MMGRRLEYQSLKAVLLHMEANVRFQISLHMPSIRNVEKIVPLKAENFYTNDHYTVVNDTSYQVGIARYYYEGNVPVPMQKEVSETGSPFDFDEFGFRVTSGDNVLLPGDVSFQLENPRIRFDTEEDEIWYRSRLRDYERALEILNELAFRGFPLAEYLRILETVPVGQYDVDAVDILRDDPEDVPFQIESYKLKLQPFECRRNNTRRSFICYIQFKMTTEEGEQIQRFEYNKQLFEAAKHLHGVLFGGRTVPIRVGKLYLCDSGIYRLPVGFRLQTRIARFSYHTITHNSLPLMVENLEGLRTLEMDSDHLQPEAYQDQTVRTARRLVIVDAYEQEWDRLVQVIGRLSNPEICIRQVYKECSPELYFTMVRAWQSGGRLVGASLWMETRNKKTAIKVLGLMLAEYEESKWSERCITVDLSNSTALEASYVQCEESKEYEESEEPEETWMLKINIVEL